MGKLEDRENRRRASVVGPIAGVEPETPGVKKGRPKEDRETKKRVADDNEILAALKKEYNVLGVIKRLAVAKKGIYDGLAVVEQTPGSEISIEYNAIADMMIAGKFEREGI